MDVDRRPSVRTKEEIDIALEKLSADWNLYNGRRPVSVREKPIRLVKPE